MPKKGVLLVFRPNWEKATEYLYAWFGEALKQKPSDMELVADLGYDDAVRGKLEDALNVGDPRLCVLGGHGNYRMIGGQNNEVSVCGPKGAFKDKEGNDVVAEFSNLALFGGRIVYALSCSFGAEGGVAMVGRGATAFEGYKVNFVFILSMVAPNPVEDPYARAFMEFSNQIMVDLMKGETVITSFNNAKKVCDKWIEYWEGVEDPEAAEIIKWLLWDRDGLVVYGDTSATVGEEAFPVPTEGFDPALLVTLIWLWLRIRG